MNTHFRIVTDTSRGFAVQAWRWWWPLWMYCLDEYPPRRRSFLTIEEAEHFVRKLHEQKKPSQVVKDLGSAYPERRP